MFYQLAPILIIRDISGDTIVSGSSIELFPIETTFPLVLFLISVRTNMENTLCKQMSPLSICSTLCGFYTVDCRNTMLKQTVQAYCWVLSLLYIILCIANLIHNICLMQHTNNASVTFLFMDIVSILTFAYYRVKFIKHHDAYNSINLNVDYADNCLQNHGNKIRHVSLKVVYIMYFVTTIVGYVHYVYEYKHIRAFLIHGDNLVLHYLIFDVLSSSTALLKFSFHFSIKLLSLQFIFVLCRICNILCSIHCAVQSINKIGATRFAWASHILIPLVNTPNRSSVFEAKRKHIKNIQFVCTSVSNTLRTTAKFYKYFVWFQLIATIFILTYNILMTSIGVSYWFLIYLMSRFLELEIIPMILVTNIQFKLQKITVLLREFCFSHELKMFKREIVKCIRQCEYADTDFDCGFFNIEVQLMTVILNFTSLFVFSLLKWNYIITLYLTVWFIQMEKDYYWLSWFSFYLAVLYIVDLNIWLTMSH